METDDIIYLSLLVFTIIFGYLFRAISDIALKKWLSTIIGVTLVVLVSGRHALHPLICTLINAIIILMVSKRQCHIISFVFTFLYLFFFRSTEYFGIPYPPAHTNLIQMMLTLKVIGLAFEVHDSYLLKKQADESGNDIDESKKVHPGFADIFHYVFCYIGVLTGPYYSYKTFYDYFDTNIYKYAPCDKSTFDKLKYVPIYMAVFLFVSNTFPLSYALTDEFYEQRSFWYRLWYISPVFTTFRMRIYIGLVLSESACCIAGLGAYPVKTQTKPGRGPTANFELLQKLNAEPELAAKEEYDFETIHNIVPLNTEIDPSVRSSIKYWNMCIQYWMAYVVYKRFPNKTLRTAATFGVSAIWHGIYAGYYLCLLAIPFYLPIEDLWEKLFRREATGLKRQVLNVIYWFVRTQTFSYTGMALILLSFENGVRYYNSVYWIYHITAVLGLGLGLLLKNILRKPRTDKKE